MRAWRHDDASRRRAWEYLLVAALVVAVVFAATFVHRVLDITRGTPVRSLDFGEARTPPAVGDPGFATLVATVAEAPLEPGHRVELIHGSREAFGRMWADLRRAEGSIAFQPYFCEPGMLADSAIDVLAERAASGVRVLFLADGYGCRSLVRAHGDELREAGVELAVFRPIHWYSLHRSQHRAHSRAVVVDGRVAYTGGFGLDDRWVGAVPGHTEWRESTARFQGPAVQRLQATFAAAWAEATGELVVGEEFFPPVDVGEEFFPPVDPVAQGVRAGILFSAPGLGTTASERFHALAVAAARRRLYVTNSYFIPPPKLLHLLKDAASRGVDVRILTPGEHTDLPSTRLAGRGFYEELLEAGVRIYEYAPAMMHAKTLVVDGTLSLVGSLNLDNRSMRLNDEIGLVILDAGLGAEMEEAFMADLARADEIELAAFRQRPWRARVLESVLRRVAILL